MLNILKDIYPYEYSTLAVQKIHPVTFAQRIEQTPNLFKFFWPAGIHKSSWLLAIQERWHVIKNNILLQIFVCLYLSEEL